MPAQFQSAWPPICLLTCHSCLLTHLPSCPPSRSTHEERLYWEQWLLDISILGGGGPPGASSAAAAAFEEQDSLAADSLRAQRRQRVQAAVEECLTAIVRHGEAPGQPDWLSWRAELAR